VLWIALHLPLLSLESFAATLCREPSSEAGHVAMALLDAQRIASANAAAQTLGVKPGLKRATALALAPRLVLGQADLRRDAQALLAVAHVALAFTPSVAIQPAGADAAAPHTVVLEVERCLRYFGGIEALLQRLHEAQAVLGHRIHCVEAPTAQGAAMLARVHDRLRCPDLATLHAALDAAPVWLLGPGREHWEALQGMGLRTLADLRRLPRAGITRRFGEALLGELDRARGEQPDPREPLSLPPRFDSRLELFARADTAEQVLQGASVLLARLTAWLAAQHAQVRRFTLVMHHEARWRNDSREPTATPLTIALAEPSRDPAHLLVLLRERLGRLQLSAPTLELQMQADEITHRALPNNELFPTPGSEVEGLTRLIERLQARLGHEQVQRLVLVNDHRPERGSPVEATQAGVVSWARPGPSESAKRSSPARSSSRARGARPAAMAPEALPQSGRGAPRPVWLLPRPEPLLERQSRPWFDGQPLQLLSGPERIESGWWDAGLAERDYFIAQAGDGALVWIYRARLPLSQETQTQGWFLQGKFA
jgi:protein ImuB